MAKRSKKRSKTKKKVKVKKKIKNKSLNKKVNKLGDNQELIIKTKAEWVNKSLVNKSDYEKKYKKSLKNNDEFWKKEGKRITWIKPYKTIKNVK